MRILRSIWVLFTNGLAVYLLYGSTTQIALLNNLLEQGNKNKAVWFQFALRVTIPILGILLEFLGSRFAKWINIGYLVFVGTVFSAVGIWNWPDHHGLIYLFLGLLALGFAGVSWLLYRTPRRAPDTSPI
jgi:hypothetical protein